MNIFYLDKSIDNCVKYHVDKHVVKMCIEYAQLLSTAHRILDNNENEILYKKTHTNHPCSIWVRDSIENYSMVYELFVKLCKEYQYRYGKVHKTFERLGEYLKDAPKNIPKVSETPFKIAISEDSECRKKVLNFNQLDVISKYRNYYIYDKQHILKWSKRVDNC
jgi:hypothetical protein